MPSDYPMERELHPYVQDCAYLIIYDYSKQFMRDYLRFLDDMVKVFNKNHYSGDNVPGEYFGVTQIVELMLDHLMTDSRRIGMDDVIADNIFDDFEDELANDIIEELTDFVNRGIYPCGLQEIAATLDDGLYLIEVVFDLKGESTYYCFENANA